jgi:hypothetical protein
MVRIFGVGGMEVWVYRVAWRYVPQENVVSPKIGHVSNYSLPLVLLRKSSLFSFTFIT